MDEGGREKEGGGRSRKAREGSRLSPERLGGRMRSWEEVGGEG